MKMKVYEKYAREIPQDATRIIASLDDPIRIAILVLLNKNNELSFSDIKKELGLTKLTLNYHLKNLYSTGLTDHYFRHELGNQKYSYYSITDLGKRVLSSLVKALIPPVPSKNMKVNEASEKYKSVPKTIDTRSASYSTSSRKETRKAVTPPYHATKS